MVIERQNVWYMDDGQLQLELCPDLAGAVEETQAEILDECQACGEAKYEVVFEGRWSRHTHPKNFPRNEWLTHFSDLIGASHSPHLKVWEVGGYSSEGLKQVALYGITRGLEGELKKHVSSRSLFSIIVINKMPQKINHINNTLRSGLAQNFDENRCHYTQ
jgi:hypothetical protein